MKAFMFWFLLIVSINITSAQFGCHQNFNTGFGWNRGNYGYNNCNLGYGFGFYQSPVCYNVISQARVIEPQVTYVYYPSTQVFTTNTPATTSTTVTSTNQPAAANASAITITLNDKGVQRSVTFTPPSGVRYVRYDPPALFTDHMEINLYDENNKSYKQVYYF